jgi:hypothetical protein
MGKEKRAFVTVVTSEEGVEPAMALGASLRASTRTADSVHNPSHKLDYICLVLREESAVELGDGDSKGGVSILGLQKLAFAGWTIGNLEYSIFNSNSENNDWELVDFNRMWIWSLVDFGSVIYVHYDMLILQDITDLFQRDVDFAAAPKLFASNTFDPGLMVINPSLSTFTEMIGKVKNGVDSDWDFDKFVNDHFSDWYYLSNHQHRLLPVYNAPYAWTQDESWVDHRSRVKAIHFDGVEKPWLILKNPTQYKVSKYGAPLIYVYAIILFFIQNPLDDGLEDETRYLLTEVFDISKSSEAVSKYIEKMKRGGTRLRIGIHDNNEL